MGETKATSALIVVGFVPIKIKQLLFLFCFSPPCVQGSWLWPWPWWWMWLWL
jgi:hypothetical protein